MVVNSNFRITYILGEMCTLRLRLVIGHKVLATAFRLFHTNLSKIILGKKKVLF